jgi:hypothetical protein
MLSKSERAKMARLEARNACHEAWSVQFRQSNGWTIIPAGVKAPVDARMTNEQRGQLELLRFRAQSSNVWTVYDYSDGLDSRSTVTTWMGDVLGRVTSRRFWRGGFGARMCAIRFKGIDGREWAGRYGYRNQECVNVRVLR